LVEEDLASAHDVSRTPIREILFALERDGLVKRVKNQGAKVVAFTADDVEEIYEIRKALESLAVRRAVPNLKLNDLFEFERESTDLRQSRRLDFVHRSKRFVFGATRSGYLLNSVS
jgi:DNA-binding GntR family transcriptional regulator